jgi:Protein of unknown function (DUF3575)
MKQPTGKRLSGRNTGYIALLVFFSMAVVCTNAQTTDSSHKTAKDLKNTIKLNISNRLIYDNALQLGYERVINKNQTINIFGGYNEFPVDLSLHLDNTYLTGTKKKSGYAFGAEYRFYLSSENKYSAPRGVYLAPFLSLYHFNSDRTLTHTDTAGTQSSANLNTQINFLNVGGELGYQFVIAKRWVIDAVVFGPAFTHYNFKAKLDNHLTGLDDNEVAQAVIDALKEKLPLLNDLTSDKEINKSGTEAFWSVGFRYSISIGFRF